MQIAGRVVAGNRVGRTIGFPTANIDAPLPQGLRDGVYAGRVKVGATVWPAVVNIGYSPSVVTNGRHRIEAHLIGFEGDLYGMFVEVELVEFIRPECRFHSKTDLSAQIERDREVARAILDGRQ